MTEQEQESGERPRSRRDSRLEVDARVVPSPEPLSLPLPNTPLPPIPAGDAPGTRVAHERSVGVHHGRSGVRLDPRGHEGEKQTTVMSGV